MKDLDEQILEAQCILRELHILNRGAALMTKQQFRNALSRSIGASKDYADGCFNSFKDNPMGYLTSRNPPQQAHALIRRMMIIGKDGIPPHLLS